MVIAQAREASLHTVNAGLRRDGVDFAGQFFGLAGSGTNDDGTPTRRDGRFEIRRRFDASHRFILCRGVDETKALMSDLLRDFGSACKKPNGRAMARESDGQVEPHGPRADQRHEFIRLRICLGIHCDEPFASGPDPEQIGWWRAWPYNSATFIGLERDGCSRLSENPDFACVP